MEILDIQLFCDLVQLKSYSKTAERNHLTQSAVSQRISNLNGIYGDMLFKNKSKVVLSNKGQEIYERFQDILNIYTYTTRVASSDNDREPISAAFCDNARQRLISPELIGGFLNANYMVDLGYSYTRTIYDQVYWGVLDYGIIGHEPQPEKGLVCRPLYKEEIGLLTCGYKLGDNTKIIDVPLLMDSKVSGLYMHIEDMLRNRGIAIEQLNVIANIGTSKDKPRILRKGNFCSFLPLNMLNIEPKLYELEMGIRSTRIFHEIYLTKNADKIHPLRMAIREHNTWLDSLNKIIPGHNHPAESMATPLPAD